MANDKIFCGNVLEKFGGDVLAVRLEVDVLRQHIYDGKGRNDEPCRYVNINVRKSQAGKWYTEIDQYKPQPQQEPAPDATSEPPPEDVDDADVPF